ncbi:MAG: epoxyqueuosine reductase [Candidatus Zhuqueibacterota bacterium]
MIESKDRNILSENINRLAASLGIDMLGFAGVSEFENYISSRAKRRDPKLSSSDAKTIIVAGIYIGGLVLPSWENPEMGRTSRLYLSGFFNDVVKPLEPIAALLRKKRYNALICDDAKNTGSILPLKLAAIRAGFGWQGKNSLLVTKKYGSFLALGGILTNADLEHNTDQQKNLCKSCTKCQQACPMNALEQAYLLNKQKCLSFLLQQDNFPEQASTMKDNRVMDCEICQQVCPWNAKHIQRPLATVMTTSFQKEIAVWEDFFVLNRLARLTEQEYKKFLGDLKTGIPYGIFHRNVLMAMERLQQN